MKRFDIRNVFGIVLIVGGAMFLLQNLGVFYGGASLLWAILVGGAGVASLYAFINNRENWWAIIPGTTLISVAFNIVLSVIFPRLGNIFGGGIVFSGIALGFWLVYLTRHSFWWAVIPAGVMFSLAAASVSEELFFAYDTDGVFLLGLGLTFLYLATLSGYEKDFKWALIPGGILVGIGILALPFIRLTSDILFPLALICAGGYLIYKNFKK
jgi:hypothetical protein